MTRVITFLTGYLWLRLSGRHVAAFISECARRGIPLWGATSAGGQVTFCSTVKGFIAMRQPARKHSCRVEVIGRRGVPFILQRAERRLFFSLGVLLFVGLLWTLSSVVWFVEVQGSEKITAADVSQTLSQAGLHAGVWRHDVDHERVANALMREFPELAWAGVKVSGSRAIVQLVDRAVIPPLERWPGDIVAARAGVVVGIIVIGGEAQVGVGDTVAVGQILISGAAAAGGHAEGLVEARVWYEAVGSAELTRVVQQASGRFAVRDVLRTMGREVHVAGPRASPYELSEVITQKRTFLPGVEHITVTYRELTRSALTISVAEAEASALAAAQSRLRVTMPSGVRISDSRTDTQWNADRSAVYVRLLVETRENIAQFLLRR